jgi:AcrR family transcriptional regulator
MVIAAERVLASHGVAGLTTNRVAEIAGVSIGSLYQYFPNKEAIAAALIEQHVSRFVGAATALVGDKLTAAPMEIVDAIGAAVASLFRETQPIHRHLRELRAAAGQIEPLDRALDLLVDLVAGYLRTRADVNLEDPTVTAFMIVHAVDGAINAFAIRQQVLPAPLDDPDTIGRELARMLRGYLEPA